MIFHQIFLRIQDFFVFRENIERFIIYRKFSKFLHYTFYISKLFQIKIRLKLLVRHCSIKARSGRKGGTEE